MESMGDIKKKLKIEYPGDYCLFLNTNFGNIKAYVYTYYEEAKGHYNRIVNSLIGDDKNNKFWIEVL